jgi:hypothetical protein
VDLATQIDALSDDQKAQIAGIVARFTSSPPAETPLTVEEVSAIYAKVPLEVQLRLSQRFRNLDARH